MSKKKTPYKMILDRVLVRRHKEEATQGGIILVSHEHEECRKGTVLAVGPGKPSSKGVILPMSVSAGDVVMFGRRAGVPMEVHGEDLLMMNDNDVIAVVAE